MAGVMGDAGLRIATVAAFKAGFEAWNALKAIEDKAAAQAAILRRSVFNQTSVQQYCEVPYDRNER